MAPTIIAILPNGLAKNATAASFIDVANSLKDNDKTPLALE